MRLDAKTEGKGDSDGGCDEDDDPDSRVNLTVEGYFPPTAVPSSPTPPPTPVSESGVAADGEFGYFSCVESTSPFYIINQPIDYSLLPINW